MIITLSIVNFLHKLWMVTRCTISLGFFELLFHFRERPFFFKVLGNPLRIITGYYIRLYSDSVLYPSTLWSFLVLFYWILIPINTPDKFFLFTHSTSLLYQSYIVLLDHFCLPFHHESLLLSPIMLVSQVPYSVEVSSALLFADIHNFPHFFILVTCIWGSDKYLSHTFLLLFCPVPLIVSSSSVINTRILPPVGLTKIRLFSISLLLTCTLCPSFSSLGPLFLYDRLLISLYATPLFSFSSGS